jgi:hypothetical protein
MSWTATSGPGSSSCAATSYPAKVWVNGREWAKRQAPPLAAPSPSWPTDSPAATIQPPCRRSGTGSARPTSSASSTAGWPASPPRWAGRPGRRLLVGAVDTPGRGLPARWCWTRPAGPGRSLRRWWPTTSTLAADEVKLIFDRRIQRNTPGTFATKLVARGVEVAVNVFYRHSRIKQYLKEGCLASDFVSDI